VWISRQLSRLAITLLVIGFGGLLYSCVVWNQYYRQLPRSPQPALGRVYVLSEKGVIAYATRREWYRLTLVEELSMIMLILGVGAGIVANPDYRRRLGWRGLELPRANSKSSSASGTS
jgi:hypothetical protein